MMRPGPKPIVTRMNNFRLDGKTALVTDAGSGRATALALAEAAAFVGLHFRRKERKIRQTLEDVRQSGGDGVLICGDPWT